MNLVREIATIHHSNVNQRLVQEYGLSIATISWEDTARTKGSCWGPNISDMTLNVRNLNMHMIRKPNFSDVSVDVHINKINVSVGNEKGGKLIRIPFKEYLANFGFYNSHYDPKSSQLLLPRDEKLLASAQACILPLGDDSDEVEFVPRIYNYQSSFDNSAVLVVVASSQGTSAHVVTERAQKLYFNSNGKAVEFCATRLSQDRIDRGITNAACSMTADEIDRNVLLVFQIPLKQKQPTYDSSEEEDMSFGMFESLGCTPNVRAKGMENAMIRASTVVQGPFRGLGNHLLERDDRYPIRLTYQFYKITDEVNLKVEDVQEISQRIHSVYEAGSNQSSLVLQNTKRQTEPLLASKELDHPRKMAESRPLFAARNP
jgi:hypothetical protein